MKGTILKDFFDHYSQNVDNADRLGYWKLSDAVIERIIQKHLDARYSGKKMTVLDAGTGTGRWIKKIIDANPDKNLEFIAYDLFESMLSKARENLAGHSNVTFIRGDLQNIVDIAPGSVDFCVSIYSPISFVDDSNRVIREIGKVLKPGAEALIMGHSYHNALDSKINNYFASAEELKELATKKLVRWNDMLPPLNVYSIADFRELGRRNRLECPTGYGITMYVKPQSEDWDPNNSKKSRISRRIEEDPAFFEKILQLELENNSKPELIDRGMNIVAVFKK